MASSHRASRENLIGRTFAESYVIERLIGGGGMGSVYLARHTRLPARFAIKVLRPELREREEVFRRFENEAQVLSSLRHPNIVQVTDYNRLPDGTLYLVMEYLEGEDLQARILKRGALPLVEVLPWFEQLASALSTAHKHGVVHRDLKPQNLFLARQDHGTREVETLKVLDFGVSKVRRPEDAELTNVGSILGTPQFMSPEQARAQNYRIDGRADQFAVAAILYYALSGKLPFGGPDPTAVLYQVLYETPRPLHEIAQVPQALWVLLRRALSKQPDDRYPTIADFAAEIMRVGQEVGVSPNRQSGPLSVPVVPAAVTVRMGVPSDDEEKTVMAPGAVANVQPTLVTPSSPIPPFPTTLSGGSGTLDRLPGRRRFRWHLLAVPLLLLPLGGLWFYLRPISPNMSAGDGRKTIMSSATSPVFDGGLPTSSRDAALVPTGLDAKLALGEALLRSGDLEGSRQAFEEGLRENPQNAAAQAGVARVELEGRNYAAALQQIREVVKREPDNPDYLLLLCQVRLRLGERGAARSACRRVLELDGGNTDAQMILRGLGVR